MALSEVSNPRRNISGYDSDAASTTQLLYEFQESVLTDIDKYVLEVVIPELNNLTLYYIPKSTGEIEFNIGPAVDRAMAGTYIDYHIVATPYRDGTAETGVTSINILAVLSRRQILSEHGANLYNYTMLATDPGKHLTVFEEPKMWHGWTKKMYGLNQDLTAFDVFEDRRDINKQTIDNNTVNYTGLTPPFVHEHTITQPFTAEYLRLSYELPAQQFLQEIYIRVLEACENPVMIEWLNSLGGYDTYLFSRQQTVTNIIEQGLTFQEPITTDIETVTETKQRYAEKDTQYMTLRAEQLTQNDLQALHDIKRSPVVRLWLDKTGSSYVTVIVNSGYEDSFTTGKSNYSYSLNIELPDNFDFFTAKEY